MKQKRNGHPQKKHEKNPLKRNRQRKEAAKTGLVMCVLQVVRSQSPSEIRMQAEAQALR